MSIFANDLVEGLGLSLPNTEKPLRSLEPYFHEAWGRSGLGDFVSKYMDVAQSYAALVKQPIALAQKLQGFTQKIPVEAIPFAAGILKLGLDALTSDHQQDVRQCQLMLAGEVGRLVGLDRDPVPAWRNAVDVPTYMDCSNRTDARARTVVPPQKMPAPWRSPGSYRQPSGNCGRGFSIWCNFAHAPHGKKKGNAGGSRCHGNADVAALLYPFWTGARPPGPAPVFVPDKWEHYYPPLDPNADMLAAQGYYLGTCEGNFRIRIADVVQMRNNLQARVGQYETMRVADPSQDYVLTDERLGVAIAMCDAFIAARAAFVRTDEAVALVASPLASKFDPDAKRETLAWKQAEIAVPDVPQFVPGVSVVGAKHQQYAVSDGEGPFVGYKPDLSAHIEAENTGGGGSGILLLGAAAGVTYWLTQGVKR